MATNAELEYLRRQNARAKANVANGVQVINQGESEETQDTSWASLAQTQGLMQEQAPTPKQGENDGNWLSNVFGFVDELAAQFGAGFVGAFEGIADLGATALGALGDATGLYDSEPFTDWASVDYASKAAEWTKNFANYTPWGIVNSVKNLGDEDYRRNWLAGLFGGPAAALVQTLRDDVDAGSQYYDYNDQALNDFKIGDFEAGNFLGGAAHSVGFMLPSIAMGGGNQIASLASMGVSAAGKGSEEALNDGANAGQALAYGAATGAAEVASEVVVGKALGVVGLGTGKVAGLVGNGVQRQAAKTGSRTFVKELIKTMNEEGMEEVSTALLEPIFKSIYKGDEALKDSTGKNIYASTEFWFGKDGHFNESVIGQYASGAFVGGMSNAIQTSSVVKKVGWEGYQALHEWANMGEADAKFSKEAIKQKLSPDSAEYASLENERGESANAFIEALDKFMAKATESQKREFARYLTQDGALYRDLQKDKNKDKAEAQIIDEYISKIRSDAGTHEGMVKRSYINQLQDQFGSDYEFDFADLGTDEEGRLKQAQIDRESKVITLNSALLKEKGGALLAHEYVQHTLGNSIKPLQADMFSALQETQSKAWKDSVEEAIGPDLKELEKQAKAEGWDSEKLEKAKTDLRQDEYAAYFLEDTFNQVNLDSQVLALKQAFKKQGAIKRFMNRLKGIPNFKISQLATNYIQSIGNFFKGLQRAFPNNPIMLALAKNAYGITLTDAEKRMKAEFGDIFKAVEKTEKLAVQNSVDRNVDKRGYLQDDNGKRIIINYNPLDISYSIAKDQTTVADYRIASADPYRMFVKSENPIFVPFGVDENEALEFFKQGYDVVVDGNDEVWVFLTDDQLVSAGEEYGKGKRFNLGDEADRRRFGELSDEAFKEYIGTSGGIRTAQEGKAYIEEIEKRHLYKINETYLEDSYGSKVVNDEEHIIPREYYTSRMKAVADLAMNLGAKEVIFYSKTTKYLKEHDAVGLFDTDIKTIYVDASVWEVAVNDLEGSELWGADQIARHELGHFLLNKDWFDQQYYRSLIRDTINAEKPFSADLEAIFKKYRRRWAHYYNNTTTQEGDSRIYEEMVVQLWSESLLMPTEEGRAWQNKLIKDFNKTHGIEKSEFNAFRYSKQRESKTANETAGEGEVVDSPKIEVEKSKVEIPNEYVKAVAQLNNDKVFAYSEATKMVREMSAEIFKALGFNRNDAYIRYNEGNIYKTTKALFDLFNKKKVTDVEIANGILELFSNISVIPKDGNAVALFGEYQNFADNSAIQEIVKKHLVDFTLSGKDSYKTKVNKRMEAFAEVYKQMRASLLAYAQDMRARIDASHTLRQTAKNMGDGIDETVTLNGTAEQNRLMLRTQMGSVLAAPLLNIIYKRNGNFGTLLKTQQNLADEIHRALENYTQEYYDKSEDRIMFPFDSELRQMMEDLEESLRRLPAPKTRKDGVVIYPNLTTSQIKQVTAILKAIKKLNAKSVRHYRDVLTPRVKGARKTLKAQESGKLYRLLWANPYTFNAASFYAIINARLGNSVFSYNLTVGMELADGKRKAYVGDTAKMLSAKIEELKIEKELAKEVVFHGVKMQVGHLIDLYCGLKSYDFDNFDKNGVTFKDKKGVVHKVVEAGEANQALADVEAALSDSAKAYGDWLLNELYNKRFMEDYIAYKEERGYHHAQVSGNYYPQSADLSDTPTDFTKLVRAPKIFQNDKARVIHNHPFVLHDASRRAMQYANDMGTALYVYPQYEDNFYVLKQVWTDLGNNPTDIKFRDSLATTLGMWVGLDVKGNKSVKGPMNFLIGNYSRTLLSFNVGTPFKQTISLLFSNLSLPNALKGVTNRLFGSSEFKAEFKVLAERYSQMAYRAIGSENLKLDMSTGAGKIVYYLRKLSDYGMKPIEWFDNATIQAGLSASMVVARDMGYEMGTEEFRKVTEDLFSVFVETQIGSNPSNLSRIARGDSPLGAVGQYASFMQGPMRAALAAFIDKVTTWRTARKWTAQEIRQAIETANDKVDVAQEAYDESAKKLADLENKRREIKESEDLEQEEKEAEIATIKESIEQAKADVEIKADELAEAKSELEQAEQNQKTFIKYRAQGGNAWFVSTVSSMAVGAVINAIIEALARRIKGKEEWDEWDGKELMENAVLYGTVGWLPLASTITNAVKGYDSSYPTGAIFQEASAIISAVSSAIQNGFDEKSAKALFREMVQALSIATGLPIKNIYSIVYGAIKLASPIMAEEMNGVFYMNYQNNAKIVKAIESGDEALAIHRISELATANCGEINESVKREYLVLMQAGESPMPSAIPTSYTNEEGESITISWTQQQTAKKFYSRANSQISKLLSDRTYRSLKESVRASIVRAIYTAYRQAALAKALGGAYDAKLTKQALLAKTGDARTGAILSAVAYIRAMEATGDKTKKELAIAYVNKLNMTKGERLIVLKMAGYGVDETQLRQALQQKGMTYSEATTFIG